MESRSFSRFVSVLVCVLTVAAAGEAAIVPNGFRDSTVVTGLTAPTAMAVAPDGRLFVCEQTGKVRVVEDGVLLATPFVALTVDSSGERGLIGIALDPAFDVNGYVYVHYTVPASTTAAPFNRVSRFTANGNRAVSGSEVELLRMNPLTGATNHNGGALHFAVDGTLLVGVGENAKGSNAQTLGNLLGKMLRINPDGTIPDTNPFFHTAAGQNRAIWALGLRNPFTFAVEPGTGRVFINDVGQNTYEEIDDGRAGANYDWPQSEGPTSASGRTGPLHHYKHGIGAFHGCAVAGGVFYDPETPQFPAHYEGDYFFADLCGGWVNRRDATTGAVSTFASGITAPVDLDLAADGSLYYLARGPGSGRIGRIECLIQELTSHPTHATVGVPITWTAAPGRKAGIEYQFWLYDLSTKSWTVGRAWDTDNTWVWTPPRAGTFALQVWARQTGSGATYEAWMGSGAFEVTGGPVVGVTLGASRTFPVAAGTAVTWTAAVVGGETVEYRFWLYNRDTKTWSAGRGYGASRTWVWIPTQPGNYAVQVWAREVGSSAVYDAWAASGALLVTAGTPGSVTLAPDTAFPVPAGTAVTWTAGMVGGGNVEYRFWLYDASTGNWTPGQGYGPGNTWSWTPPKPGTYVVQVWVRQVGSTAAYEAWAGSGPITIAGPFSSVTLVADRSLPVAAGTTVTWTATAVGGATAEYRFWLYNGNTGAWTTGQADGPDNTWEWTPGQAGTYSVQVWVREVGSSAIYQAWAGSGFFTVTP